MLDVAQAWQQSVKAGGINVELKQYPLSTYWTDAYLVTPAFMDYWNYYSPESLFDLFCKDGAPFGVNHHDDPKLDEMSAAINAEVDDAKRTELIHSALLQARQEFDMVIPVYTDAAFARSARAHGLVWNYVDCLDFRKAWYA